MKDTLRSWVEVDLEAIAYNLDLVRQLHPHAALMPVIKAEAYGHGQVCVARRLDNDGISFFAVANVNEARRLRFAEIRTPAFILGPCFAHEREELVANDWGCTVSTLDELKHFNTLAATANKQFHLHVALDTGMGREGFLPHQLDDLIALAPSLKHLVIDGAMTHCPSADDDLDFTNKQIKLFTNCVEKLSAHFDLKYRHIAASAALLAYDVPVANLLRPGLILYGVAPIATLYEGILHPTLRLCSRITLIRNLPAGHGISYGRSYKLMKPTRIATIGIGYADGWMRCLSGTGVQVHIKGQLCPMIGRVTMDQIMVDVSAVANVEAGDEVQLICAEQKVEQIARFANTIPWEIFTSIGSRVPRLYV